MCGFIGVLSLNPIDRDEFVRLTRLMSHRGPDGEGIFTDDINCQVLALGHRRLSVIDLTSGSQPMFNEDGSIGIVFNGEIYNFKELRKELKTKGHTFRSASDTEVILHGFEEWGEDLPRRLEGMFAFAIYSREQQRLFLARDRLGQKPLFYSQADGLFAFASELEPLVQLLPTREFARSALAEYLTHGFVCGERTCYQSCFRLLPGHWLDVRKEGIRCRPYWTLPRYEERRVDDVEDLVNELDKLLRDAVRKRLVSDVPLGAFLSGGLDSSLIVAMMAKEKGGKVETFSIGFSDPTFDESSYARRVADYIGVNHTQERIDLTNPDALERVFLPFGEPFGDSSAIPTLALSAATRKHVTVALSGDGGDELFGGYQRYLGRKLVAWYLRAPRLVRRALARAEQNLKEGVEYYGTSLVKKARLFMGLTARVENGAEGLPVFFHPEEIRRLIPVLEMESETYPQELMRALDGDDILARMMSLDLQTYLPEDILAKVDRMSMLCSLEVRSPFMDHSVVEFSQSIPTALKVKGLTTKYVLKRLGLRYLPKEIVFRQKHGFSVPLGRWFRGKLGDHYLELLRGVDGYLCRTFAEELLGDHRKGLRDHSHRLWLVLVLVFWLTRFKCRESLSAHRVRA